MTGADVLRVLVELTARPPTDRALEPAAHPRKIARAIDAGARDGRAVSMRLSRLVDARLATKGHSARRLASGRVKEMRGSSTTVYTPTERGREVDRLLAGATVARGGVFQPRSSLGLDVREELALR
jgi:hypothetical protein